MLLQRCTNRYGMRMLLALLCWRGCGSSGPKAGSAAVGASSVQRREQG